MKSESFPGERVCDEWSNLDSATHGGIEVNYSEVEFISLRPAEQNHARMYCSNMKSILNLCQQSWGQHQVFELYKRSPILVAQNGTKPEKMSIFNEIAHHPRAKESIHPPQGEY